MPSVRALLPSGSQSGGMKFNAIPALINAPSAPQMTPSPASTNVSGGSSRRRRKRRAANVMRNACAMTNPV